MSVDTKKKFIWGLKYSKHEEAGKKTVPTFLMCCSKTFCFQKIH